MKIRRKRCSAADEMLTPAFSYYIFMDGYFISFRLLTHRGVNII